MTHISKYIDFITELKDSTLDSAAKLAKEYGQNGLSKRFQDHKDYLNKRRNDSIFRLFNDYKFKFFLDSFNGMGSGDEHWPEKGKEIVEIQFNYDYQTEEDNSIDITYSVTEEYKHQIDLDFDDNILAKIDFFYNESRGLEIEDYKSVNNKFASRKEAIKFVKFLQELYLLEDKNQFAKIAGKLNKTKLSRVENDGFAGFVDRNFGDFKTFKSKIKIRTLYDVH